VAADSPRPDATPFESLRSSQLTRILGIGALIALLQVPVSMIRGVIDERAARRDGAVAEVTGRWGGTQQIAGPRLVVPYMEVVTRRIDDREERHRRLRFAHFLPEELEIDGRVDSETLERGIFDIPVYRMDVALRGRFARPDFEALGVDPDAVLWDRAHLVVEVSDARAIQHAEVLDWNQAQLPLLPGAGESDCAPSAIHAALGKLADGDGAEFQVALQLNGSEGAFFAPFGRDTTVALSGDWPHPSFQGMWLPKTRDGDDAGFAARWEIPHLGRNYPQSWRTGQVDREMLQASSFGVRLATPVDAYRMSQRSAKYANLFLLLTFGTLWLFEVLANVRVHSVQLLLLGAALCLFFLIETSLAEHLGFGLAYVLASAGVVGLIAVYSWSILHRAGRAALLGGLSTALYGYLYVLLTNQDYALLAGSLGLFGVLALVMYVTRRVDWDAVGRKLAQTAGQAA
jgi:inner membrane protein